MALNREYDRAAVGVRVLEPRYALEDLSNIITEPLPDGCLCSVISMHNIYYLDKFSVASVLLPDVVPTALGAASPGRWLRLFVPPSVPPVCGPIVDGAYAEILPANSNYPTQVIWWDSVAKNYKLQEIVYTRNAMAGVHDVLALAIENIGTNPEVYWGSITWLEPN